MTVELNRIIRLENLCRDLERRIRNLEPTRELVSETPESRAIMLAEDRRAGVSS